MPDVTREIHLYRHAQTAWKEVARPWLANESRHAARRLARSYIIVPTRGQAHALKQRCLADGIPLLGVEFLTPGLARRKWAAHIVGTDNAAPVMPPSLGREFLLLGLRTIIDRHLRELPETNLTGKNASTPENRKNKFKRGTLKSLQTDCERALDDFDDLIKCGFGSADFENETVRDIFTELDTWVTNLGHDFALRQTARFVQNHTAPVATHPGRLLIHGFSAEQRSEFFNIAALALCFDDVTLTLPEPEFRGRKALDESWIELWEATLRANATPIDEPDTPISCESIAEIWASSAESPSTPSAPTHTRSPANTQTRLHVGLTRADEMELVAREIATLLDNGAENIGVIFPTSDDAHLRLVRLLSSRAIPLVDQLESIATPEDALQSQRALLAFYERDCRLEELFALWPHLNLGGTTDIPLPRARQIIERLFENCMAHSLAACLPKLAANNDPSEQEVSRIATLLSNPATHTLAWPAELTLAEALLLFTGACARLELGEIPKLRALSDFAAREKSTLPAQIIFTTLREFLSENEQLPGAPGRGCFARVTLTTRRRAEGAFWSHLIFVEANAGVWPQRQESTGWLDDNTRKTLNTRPHPGPDLLTADDRAFLEKRSYAALARDTHETIIFTGALFDEEEPELRLAPNSWVERVRWQALTQTAPATVPGLSQTPLVKITHEEIFGKLAQSVTHPKTANPAIASDDIALTHWHTIWNSRRDPARPFDEYFFSIDPHAKPITSIAARRIEAGFKDPASLWFDAVLGLPRMDWTPLARNRQKSLGILAHTALAMALRGDHAEGNFQSMPNATTARAQLSLALDTLSATWPKDCYWSSFREELANICSVLLGKVLALKGDFVAAEYTLPPGITLPVAACEEARLGVRGRMDLARLDRPDWTGAHVQIVDFKTGKDTKISAATMAKTGASLQLAIYLAAARERGAADGSVLMLKPVSAEPTSISMHELPDALAGLSRIHAHITQGRYGALTADKSEYSHGTTEWPIACAPISHAILKQKFAITFGAPADDAESEASSE